MLDQHRDWFKGLESLTADVFAVLPLKPNHYTALSIVFAASGAYFMFAGEYRLVLLFFILAMTMDFVDGAVARRNNLSSAKGAYLDNIADRYVEGIFLFGLMFVPLPQWILPSFAWIFLAFLGSLMTTYAKASAKEKELSRAELKGGLLSRGERAFIMAAVFVALIYFRESVVYLLALLALLSNFTAGQRIYMALKK